MSNIASRAWSLAYAAQVLQMSGPLLDALANVIVWTHQDFTLVVEQWAENNGLREQVEKHYVGKSSIGIYEARYWKLLRQSFLQLSLHTLANFQQVYIGITDFYSFKECFYLIRKLDQPYWQDGLQQDQPTVSGICNELVKIKHHS